MATQLEGTITTAYGDAKKKIQEGTAFVDAANPRKSAEKIRTYGSQVADIAGKLPGYADEVSDYGKQIAKNSQTLIDRGNDYLGIGGDILGMNPQSSSPFVRELLRLYGTYDPDRQVSFAAQDVSNAFDATEGSMKRDMARQGINPSSGRSSWLNQQLAIAKSTALAAAMTRRRNLANGEQASAFQSLVQGGANAMNNQGKDFLVSGNSGLATAAGETATAAGILSNSGSLFGSAAGLESQAYGLENTWANQMAGQKDKEAAIDTATANYYSGLERALISADTAMAANADSTSVYEDMSGNRVYSYKGNVTAYNKTDDGWIRA